MNLDKKIHFVKMHGLGNDFVIIDNTKQNVSLDPINIQTLSNRHFGIGFDQLLILTKAKSAHFYCQIFNADGSEAEQCGNGLRCVARYLAEIHQTPANSLTIETKAGIFPIDIKDFDHIRIRMGIPTIQFPLQELTLTHDEVEISAISLGNPHAIIKVLSLDAIFVSTLGEEIAHHSIFINGANVGFMQIVSPNHIRLRTFERGVGETYACGSNACAAVCAGIINHWLDNEVRVDFHHGSLTVEWRGADQPVYLTGPATNVYEGMFSIHN